MTDTPSLTPEPVSAPAAAIPPAAPEQQPEPSEIAKYYRLKKGEDGHVFGPITGATLLAWANEAQVAPIDLVDEQDDNWAPACSYDFLKMEWHVRLQDGQQYGPTTVGTLREFLKERIVVEDAMVTHDHKKTRMPLVALLAMNDFEPKKYVAVEIEGQRYLANVITSLEGTTLGAKLISPNMVDMNEGSVGISTAKELRIRNLEEELRASRKEYDELMHRFRQLSAQKVS
ncbi:MAG TPA: hypothetical protein VK970_07910 [Candidatus Methylacidiphilales bacterium]|nr:hypothetical protein [Candidatus Methylacidiphilales bacterium]